MTFDFSLDSSSSIFSSFCHPLFYVACLFSLLFDQHVYQGRRNTRILTLDSSRKREKITPQVGASLLGWCLDIGLCGGLLWWYDKTPNFPLSSLVLQFGLENSVESQPEPMWWLRFSRPKNDELCAYTTKVSLWRCVLYWIFLLKVVIYVCSLVNLIIEVEQTFSFLFLIYLLIPVLCRTLINLMCMLLQLVEVVPSALVLFILRKLPPRRVSDRYHPIEWSSQQ